MVVATFFEGREKEKARRKGGREGIRSFYIWC
jgi:hypothetical protein